MIATLRVFAQRPQVNALLEIDGRTVPATGPFVFIGNNEYSVRLLATQFRTSLTEGKLCVYTARRNGVSGLLRFLWLALWDRLDQTRDFEMRTAREVIIRLARPSVRVAKDGEVLRLATPLEYRIAPLALELFSPA
jgi:diacylglycerol kinase family enzyme